MQLAARGLLHALKVLVQFVRTLGVGMAKITIKATKMLNADASHISLVDRGANRTPFQIVKQEKPMSGLFAPLDLTRVFARKSEAPAIQVVGVATMKDDSFDETKEQISEAGFRVEDQVEMEDASVVFKQEGEADGEGCVVRISDSVALVMKNFVPHEMDIEYGDKTFSEVVKEQGFYPSVAAVLADLSDSIPDMVAKADSPTEAAELVSKMFDEAKLYATTMVGALPVEAFKLEVAQKACKPKDKMPEEPAAEDTTGDEKKAKKDEGTTEEPVAKEDGAPTDPAPAAEVIAAPAPVVEPEHKETPAVSIEKGLTEEQVSNIVSNHTGKAIDALAKKVEEMIGTLSTAVQKSVTDLGAKVDQATEIATKAEAAIKGAVVTGSDTDDRGVRKSEPVGIFGGREIDTGYMTRDQRQRARR